MVISEIAQAWVRLLAPFIPYTSEKLWEEVGDGRPIAFAEWPAPDETKVDPYLELSEELLSRTVEDIESIVKLIQIEPEQMTLFIAPDWKYDIFSTVASAEDRKKIIGEIMKDEAMRARGKEATDAAKQVTNLIHRLPPELVRMIASSGIEEMNVFKAGKDFLEREFGVKVSIIDAGESTHPKARGALPFKPAILIE